jgi:hypothetical protein
MDAIYLKGQKVVEAFVTEFNTKYSELVRRRNES